MAESNKTEKATPKKRRDERKKGHVMMSKDAVTVASIFVTFSVVYLWGPSIVDYFNEYLIQCMYYAQNVSEMGVVDTLGELVPHTIVTMLKCMTPIFAVTILVSVVVTFFQTKMLVSTESIKPKLSKINPINGFKKLFSLKSVVEALKGLLKISVLIYIVFNYIRGMLGDFFTYLNTSLIAACAHCFQQSFYMVMQVGVAFTALAALDFFYQNWEFERDMKMTKQEVKDEYKQLEGDPQVKGKIKERQRQMAQMRMMQQVPQADVIIRNPTHVAVALRYKPDVDNAPIVLAMGLDELALRIVRVGEEHNITVIENVTLARALYAESELDREIPPGLYGAVADVLVHLYKIGKDGKLNQ